MRDLRKAYGEKEAVGGIDLEVRSGEIFTFLGPNGAGKTTTVEILEGYRNRDAGEIEVLGQDPAHPTREWRSRIGVVLQTCDVWPELTVGESLSLFARYYPEPLSVDRTLELIGLRGDRNRRTGQLSGGQKRRLDVGLALIGNPELLFLDEPTTGFDPAARHHAWDVIAGLRELGKTVFLTTHYMDEAEALADRVAVIVDGSDRGRGIAAGARRARSRARDHLVRPAGWSCPRRATRGAGRRAAGRGHTQSGSTPRDRPPRSRCSAPGLSTAGFELAELEVRRPTLEDVYLRLTDGR